MSPLCTSSTAMDGAVWNIAWPRRHAGSTKNGDGTQLLLVHNNRYHKDVNPVQNMQRELLSKNNVKCFVPDRLPKGDDYIVSRHKGMISRKVSHDSTHVQHCLDTKSQLSHSRNLRHITMRLRNGEHDCTNVYRGLQTVPLFSRSQGLRYRLVMLRRRKTLLYQSSIRLVKSTTVVLQPSETRLKIQVSTVSLILWKSFRVKRFNGNFLRKNWRWIILSPIDFYTVLLTVNDILWTICVAHTATVVMVFNTVWA